MLRMRTIVEMALVALLAFGVFRGAVVRRSAPEPAKAGAMEPASHRCGGCSCCLR